MKKIAAALAALTALGVGLAPVATADSVDEYMADLTGAGFTVTGQNGLVALTMGLGVCVDLFNGTSLRDEIASVSDLDGLDTSSAGTLVRIAVANLCPAATAGWTA